MPRKVDPREVPCPTCGAGNEEPCRRPSGRKLPGQDVHDGRRVAARERDAPLDALDKLATREGRDLYASIVEELDARDEAAPWTRALAFRIAANHEEATNAHRLAAEQPLVTGSQGQSVAHPMWTLASRLEDRVLADLKALRFTPDTGRMPLTSGVVGKDPGDEERDDLDELDELAPRRAGRAGA